jgi:dTDP-4-amino-4,6-dideoxygalactose transaminase
VSWRIPLSDLRISPAQRDAVNQVLTDGWLSMGPSTEHFEQTFAEAAGVEHAIGVSSATTGLLVALDACGVGPGDEVIVPSLNFVADANVVTKLGATPVLVDIESVDRPLVDVDAVHRAVTDRTRAVVVVHYAGYLADVGRLTSLAEAGIRIIEDAAHAAGPVADDGTWHRFAGHAAVFSFFANKNLPTGEGGIVLTADPEMAAAVRLLRAHGMTTGTWDRHRGHASSYDVVRVGWNCRPNELASVLGSAGLPDLPAHNARRRELLEVYRHALHDGDPSGQRAHLIMSGDEPTAAHLAVAVLPPGGRPAVHDALAAAGIQSSFHYPPIHHFTAYAGSVRALLPQTDEAAERFVSLPLHPYLTDDDVEEIVEVVLKAVPAA